MAAFRVVAPADWVERHVAVGWAEADVPAFGISYPNKRAEAGDVVSDFPASSIPWLLEQGYIVADAKAATAPSTPADGGTA